MSNMMEFPSLFFGVGFAILLFCTVLSFLMRSERAHDGVWCVFDPRMRAWWYFAILLFVAVSVGRLGVVVFFGIISFQCLREYLSVLKTHISDHWALILCFYFFLPFNYIFLGCGWIFAFFIFIPLGVFLLLPIAVVLKKDNQHFVNRIASIQWGVMICVCFLAYLPAIFLVEFESYKAMGGVLLLFFLVMVQISNVIEYGWSRWFAHVWVLKVSKIESKTLVGGVVGFLGTFAFSVLLIDLLPFSLVELFFITGATCFASFLGGVVLQALKFSNGVERWCLGGAGHVGLLDMMSSYCFAAPVFFYICWFT